MATVRPAEVDQQAGFALEDDRVTVVVLPGVGSKIVSLRHRPSGREWIWRNPARRIVPPTYDSPFDRWDISGYDDCFPTIGACRYPDEPWRGIAIPDHGEVWTLPWSSTIEGDTVVLDVTGIRFPYRLRKVLALDDAGLRLDYTLTNPTPFPFHYLFSAHPLLAATATTEVEIPRGARLRVDSSIDRRLGERFDEHSWPITRDRFGATVDLRRLDPTAGFGDKLYTTRLSEGWARLIDRATGDWLRFAWDPAELPLLGLWLNQGGWPSPHEPTFNVALEPCTGYPDPLDLARAGGEHATAPPGGTVAWSLRVDVGQL